MRVTGEPVRNRGKIHVLDILWMVFGSLCLLYYFAAGISRSFHLSALWIWFAGGVFFWGVGFAGWVLHRRGRTWFRKRWLRRTVATVLALACFYVAVIEGMVAAGMASHGEPGLDYVIVLGAGVYGTEPSPALQSRIDTAARYLQENPQTTVIVSGGQGPGEDISEAECMARELEKQGISADRIWLEPDSATTVQNIRNSFALIGDGEFSVGIVTSNFHVFRAVLTASAEAAAAREGTVRLCGIAAPFTGILLPHYMVRETLAFTVDFIFGRFHTDASFWKMFS